MKKILVCISLFGAMFLSYAQYTGDKNYNPPITWQSKNSTDVVTIQNGTGVALYVTINVDGNGTGIAIKNCGVTTHIDAGSTGICFTKDPINFITFNSDKISAAASGTYYIRQQ